MRDRRKKSYFLVVGIMLLIVSIALANYLSTGNPPRLPGVEIKLLDYTHEKENESEARFQVTNEDSVVIERINSYRFQIPRKVRSSNPSRDGRNFAIIPFSTNTPKLLKPGESMILNVTILTNAPSWRLQLHYATGAPPKRSPLLHRFLRIFPRYRRIYHPVQCDWIKGSPTVLLL